MITVLTDILYISRYGQTLFWDNSVHFINRLATQIFSLLHLSKRVKYEVRRFSDETPDGITIILSEGIVFGAVVAYFMAAICLFCMITGFNLSNSYSLFFIIFPIPSICIFIFLFRDEKVRPIDKKIKAYVKMHGPRVVNVITWTFTLGSIICFFLSLHLYSIFGNHTG